MNRCKKHERYSCWKSECSRDNAGQVSVSTDGDIAFGIGGGLTIDSDGDLGLQIAPGISLDLGGND